MIRVLVVHETRLSGALLALAIDALPGVTVIGSVSSLEDCFSQAGDCDVVLVWTRTANAAVQGMIRALARPEWTGKVVVVGVDASEGAILPYIEAGASGYVLGSSSVEDLIRAVQSAHCGEAHLEPDIAAALMARLAQLTSAAESFSKTQPAEASPDLTLREREVLELIGRNQSNAQIAQQLAIEPGTVKNHVHNILKKLNVSSRAAAAARGLGWDKAKPEQAGDSTAAGATGRSI